MSLMSEARLAICNSCSFNVEGNCALCGCIIAEKVEKIEESCPDTPQKWIAATGPNTIYNPTNTNACIPCAKKR